MIRILIICIIALIFIDVKSQETALKGRVVWKGSGNSCEGTEIILKYTPNKTTTNAKGDYEIGGIKPGNYTLVTFTLGLRSTEKEVVLKPGMNEFSFTLDSISEILPEVIVQAELGSGFGLIHRQSVDGMDIFAGKKNEIILLENINGNLATNNSRQVYSRVAGLNIWESDQGGVQLGIGGRGLSPNRTSNFNTRQNGYDIAADALGYPESYYTPPTEGLASIDVVRGAASLQYGTQFGGVVNFRMKEAETNKKIGVESIQTTGSYGLFNSYNAIGGKFGKVSYYTFFQYKRGDGWRPNSTFNQYTAFASIGHQLTEKFNYRVEYTRMNYLAQQPGGLTDKMFEDDPSQSIRNRNWFQVNWNVFSLRLTYVFSPTWRMEMRNFGLVSSREALGILGYINRADPGGNRDLLSDTYSNYGNETRLIHTYNVLGNPSNLLFGARVYRGFTVRKQGEGNDGAMNDFEFNNPSNLEHSYYEFPSQNVAFFGENVIQLSPKWSVTPGVRYENIQTQAEGYYKLRVNNLAGNALIDTNISDSKESKRSFVLFGIGTAFKLSDKLELYGSISQNYRAINFNDMRVNNPNFKVDSALKDESGYSGDIGVRGGIRDVFILDVSAFYLNYTDRIGSLIKVDDRTYQLYRMRTNVANSRSYGLESFMEMNLLRALTRKQTQMNFSVFLNATVQDAIYRQSQENGIENNKVEDVPSLILKTGMNIQYGKVKLSYQYSYTSEQYTDATNSVQSPTAITGIIPAYSVMDLSLSYEWKKSKASTGINNLLDASYFSRRADGYPGPGIIPADPLNAYLSLGVKF